jgi:nitroreductase
MNFLELTKNRYSCRAYKSLNVEKEKLDYILECVRFAPSAVNKQPWLFHIVSEEEEKAKLHSAIIATGSRRLRCIL